MDEPSPAEVAYETMQRRGHDFAEANAPLAWAAENHDVLDVGIDVGIAAALLVLKEHDALTPFGIEILEGAS